MFGHVVSPRSPPRFRRGPDPGDNKRARGREYPEESNDCVKVDQVDAFYSIIINTIIPKLV
jgi:hypothetical protein